MSIHIGETEMKENREDLFKVTEKTRKQEKRSFGNPNCRLDSDPSRQLQPVKRASAMSTASASASTLTLSD